MARFSNQMRIIAMTQIGAFTRKEDGFFGRVRPLVFDAAVSIPPIDESDTQKAPNHRVFCTGMEVGGRTTHYPLITFSGLVTVVTLSLLLFPYWGAGGAAP